MLEILLKAQYFDNFNLELYLAYLDKKVKEA